MRLASLQLLDKAFRCYGMKMLKVYEESDIYKSLLRFYGIFPFNDMAHQMITNILAFALDFKQAQKQEKEMKKTPQKKFKFNFGGFSLFEN